MSKTAGISVLTANRLGDGIVVFLDFEGAWSEGLAEAVVARSPDEVRALQDRGTYDAEHNLVVEPYLVEVGETAGGLVPIRYRERVRVAGPSILDDVPGYAAPAAVVRQAHHEVGDRGNGGDADRAHPRPEPHIQPRPEPHIQPRPEPVEGRAASSTHAQAA
jgi:Protein of unknown function (DUF2849)